MFWRRCLWNRVGPESGRKPLPFGHFRCKSRLYLVHYSTQTNAMAPTAAADTRQAVLSCVRSSSSQQIGELFSVDPEGSTPQQWADASLPYNTRLADEIGPLAIVYRESSRDGALTRLDARASDAERGTARHPGQIAAAIRCADSNGVPAVARSGGHSYGAYSLGGSVKSSPKASSSSSKLDTPRPAEESLIIDMREFRHVDYDAKSQLVRVGSGAMLGELNEELERHGRMVPSGSCPTVGGLASRCVRVAECAESADRVQSVRAVVGQPRQRRGRPRIGGDLDGQQQAPPRPLLGEWKGNGDTM
jgi:hypothetical protein